MNEILKLAQNRCANFAGGRCLVTDRTCLYGSPNADIRRCSYFETSVLPAEPAIEAKYYAARGQVDNKPRCEQWEIHLSASLIVRNTALNVRLRFANKSSEITIEN